MLLLAFAFAGYAEENAHYKMPYPSASFVDPNEMPQFLSPKLLPNRHGIKRGITEGFMIRQSYVKDEKIVIPPGGLIYFTFGGEYFSNLNGEPFVISGKESIWIEKEEAMVIKKNFTVSLNKPPIPLGEKGTIALAHTYYNDRYLGGEQCKSLDTVVGEVGLYMGGQVMTNIYGQVYNNLNWTKPKYVNRLMQENQRLKSMGESTRK